VVIVVIGLVIIGAATGALKGSFTISKTDKSPTQDQKTASKDKIQEPSPSPSPLVQANLAQEAYTDSQKGFSIKPPQDWKVDDGQSTSFYEGATMKGSPAALVVTIVPLGSLKGAQLSTVVDTTRLSLKKEYPNSAIQTDQQTKIGNYDAHLLRFDYSQEGVTYQTTAYLTIDNENLYNIITVVDKNSISKYDKLLEDSVDTFKLLKN
jgi:hypothetical protein